MFKMCQKSSKMAVAGFVFVASCVAMIFSACGDSGTTEQVTNNYTTGLNIVAAVDDLADCGKDNDGEQVFVKDESAIRVCSDGKWYATIDKGAADTVYVNDKDTVYVKGGDTVYVSNNTCTTAALSDSSGVKIICGGDSVGVVLNGKDGAQGVQGETGSAGSGCSVETLADNSGLKVICGGDSVGVVYNGVAGAQGEKGDTGETGAQGETGAGCAVASSTDTTVTVKCGDDSFTMKLNGGSVSTRACGDETCEIEDAGLSGFSQKGPFVNGARVSAYELQGNKSLKQTGRAFVGKITSDDGKFSMSNMSLVSSYVQLEAEGYYRNEVTGKNSNSSIVLNAYTDLTSRSKANVNLLTHLEYYRVNYLMATSDGTLKIRSAKKSAENEILASVFGVDASSYGYAEDLDVFGTSEGDAALLALSIMLQGDRSEADLTSLLSTFGEDIRTDGVWDGTISNSTRNWRDSIADWVFEQDLAGNLATYRMNVANWGLGDVPPFEKYIRKYYGTELGIGVCGDDVEVGTVKEVSNAQSVFYADGYTDQKNKVRYTCDNSTKVWRRATDIEKDTMGMWHGSSAVHNQASVIVGLVDSNYAYVYEGDAYRRGTSLDYSLGLNGCTEARRDTVAKSGNTWYKCAADADTSLGGFSIAQAWRVATDIEKDTMGWGHAFSEGDVRNGKENTTFTYVYEDGNWRLGTSIDSLMYKQKADGGKACVKAALTDTSKVKVENLYYVCTTGTADVASQWVEAPTIYNDTYENRSNCTSAADGDLMNGRINSGTKYVCDFDDSDGDGSKGWESTTTVESVLGGCRSRQQDSVGLVSGTYYACVPNKWTAGTGMWVKADEARYNTYHYECTRDGALVLGSVNTDKYYTCDADTFRVAANRERILNQGCVNYLQGTKVAKEASDFICEQSNWTVWKDTLKTGRAGEQNYLVVRIGTQIWMAENLNYVPDTTDEKYAGYKERTWCYGNSADSCDKYGRLYTWAAAMDSAAVFSDNSKGCGFSTICTATEPVRGTCPEGWHLPSETEWSTLFITVGGSSSAGEILKSSSGWKNDGNGTDAYGFSALPAGFRSDRGNFDDAGDGAYFWSSTESSSYDAYYMYLNDYLDDARLDYYSKAPGFSVRCLKDSE